MTDQRQAASNQHCEAIADLATAVHDEPERAVVLCRGASFSSCSSELEQLSRVADTLVLLAPEIDPPVGFEMHVVERMHVGPPSPGPDDFGHEQHRTTWRAPARSEP